MTTVTVHLGAAKTGSTALQSVLGLAAADLARTGIWFPTTPPFVLPDRSVPKHQPLVRLVRADDLAGISHWVEVLRASVPAGCDHVILSAEGLWRHAAGHGPAVEHALRQLAPCGLARGVLVTRNLPELQASLYKQAVGNPPGDQAMSTTLVMPDWLALPDVASLWNTAAFVRMAEEALDGAVDVLDYGLEVVPRAWVALTRGRIAPPVELDPLRQVHASLDDDATELLRLVTRSRRDEDRQRLIRALRRLQNRRPPPPIDGLADLLTVVRVEDVQPPCGEFRPSRSGVARSLDRLRSLAGP